MNSQSDRRFRMSASFGTMLGIGLVAATLLGVSGLGLRPLRAGVSDPSRQGMPNVLILIGDDHAGGTLGIDGDPRQATPRLDRLARQGIRFDRSYCNAPLCTPSRQSFITGRLPHSIGVTQLNTALPAEAITLADWLGERGYETAAFGKMHFNGASRHGFVERLDIREWLDHLKEHPPEGGDRRRPWHPFKDPAAVWLNAACQSVGLPASAMASTFFADRAIEFIGRPRERPFCLVVGFYDPHAPFQFPREWEGRYRPEDFAASPLSAFDRGEQPQVFASLTREDARGIQAAYFSALSFLDHQVGRILDGLDASGKAGETIVVYLGDNGYMLGQHGRFEKHCFYEPAVRVPLIVRPTGRFREGSRVAELVELVDVVPTLLDLLALPQPPDLHGKSLVPLLKGVPCASGREVVVSEYLENEEAMARSSRYKLIVGTGRRLRQDGYRSLRPLPGPYERLYDLENDPGEATDLAGRAELADVEGRLRHALHDRLVSTRRGLEPVPDGLSEIESIRWCLVPRDRPGP